MEIKLTKDEYLAVWQSVTPSSCSPNRQIRLSDRASRSNYGLVRGGTVSFAFHENQTSTLSKGREIQEVSSSGFSVRICLLTLRARLITQTGYPWRLVFVKGKTYRATPHEAIVWTWGAVAKPNLTVWKLEVGSWKSWKVWKFQL